MRKEGTEAVTEDRCCGGASATSPPPAESGGCCGPAAGTAEPSACCCEAATAAPAKQSACSCGPAESSAAKTQPRQSSCCGAPAGPPADYAYGPTPYLVGESPTAIGPVPRVSSGLTRADRLGAWRVRWGIARDDYRVRPGLYALGTPDASSPVLVTANYKLTLDALRSSVPGTAAWLLVVDTRGINVWCAAGKGTFSAEEVARMVAETRLSEVVAHRRLILPQLAAPGVAAHRVTELSGFRVTFGPVRAADLPGFLAAGLKADTRMRTVSFDTRERLVLAPAELRYLWDRRMLLAFAGVIAVSSVDADGVSLRRGLRRGLPVVGAAGLAVIAGGGITPALLPWLPGRAFSLKGAAAGAVVAAGTAAALRGRLSPAAKLTLLAGVPAAASYAAMNFTGSSPITSPSGVQREMRRSLPLQAAGAALAVGGWLLTRMGR
jgi:CO dehydrogenase/acetyl-CoA synthase delta subunit